MLLAIDNVIAMHAKRAHSERSVSWLSPYSVVVALVLCAGGGIVIGLGMGFGGAWVATIVGLSGLALFIQLLIVLFQMAL